MNQLNVNQQQTILTLRRQGWSKRRIARELDLDRATERKYLAEADSKPPTPQTGSAQSPSSKSPTNPQTGSSVGCGPASLCEPWREQIEEARAQGMWIPRVYQGLVVEPRSAGWSAHQARNCRWILVGARGCVADLTRAVSLFPKETDFRPTNLRKSG